MDIVGAMDLRSLAEHRHFLAPVAGAVAMLGAVFGLDMAPTFAIVLGALVWGGLVFVLKTESGFADLARIHGEEGTRIAGELDEASRRVARLRMTAAQIENWALRATTERIAASAEAIIADTNRNIRDYGRTRKALTQYLPHAEQIADHYVYMVSIRDLGPELDAKAREALQDLEKIFIDYKRRMVEDESFDLDARIELLKSEMMSEGIDRRDRLARGSRGEDG